MTVATFDPYKTYEVFAQNSEYTGESCHQPFYNGRSVIEGLDKPADEGVQAERLGMLSWFEDNGYTVHERKRRKEE